MRNMYAISIGLTLAGGGCLLMEKMETVHVGYPSFELTGIGGLLVTGGLMLLLVCLVASAEACVKRRWIRVVHGISWVWRRSRRNASRTTESC